MWIPIRRFPKDGELLLQDYSKPRYMYFKEIEYAKNILNNFEVWSESDISNLRNKMHILLAETNDSYVLYNIHKFKEEKISKNTKTDNIQLDIINAYQEIKNNVLIIKGKYTDFHQQYIDREKEREQLRKYYGELIRKIKIFGSPYNVYIIDAENRIEIKAAVMRDSIRDIDTIAFSKGITHVEFRIFENDGENIHKIILPSTIRKIDDNINLLRGLKEVRFSEGLEYLDYDSIACIENNDVDIYFPESLKCISQKYALDKLIGCKVHLSKNTKIV